MEWTVQITTIAASTILILAGIFSACKWLKHFITHDIRNELDLFKQNVKGEFSNVKNEFSSVNRKIEDLEHQMNDGFAEMEQKIEDGFVDMEKGFEDVFNLLQDIQQSTTFMNFDLTNVEEKVFQLEHKPVKPEATSETKPLSMRGRMQRARRGRQKNPPLA